MNSENVGNRIREERLKNRLTQEQLAGKADVSEAYIGRIERRKKYNFKDIYTDC